MRQSTSRRRRWKASPITDKRSGWHWTDYWRGGRAEVLTVQTANGPLPLDTSGVWADYFPRFQPGARLIDLATGSGQVAGYAAEAGAAGGLAFEVVGVDYADLDTDGRGPDGVTLMGGVSLEDLPFEASRFDGAASQFGIEYADARRALPELARVLKPGGRCQMLLHHAASVITLQTAMQIAAYDRVMGSGAAVRQARRAFTTHLKGAPEAALRQAETAFAAAVQRASDRLAPEPAYEQARYLVGYLADLSSRIARYDAASALARLDIFEAGNAAWRHRQQSQVRAAMDAAGLEAFVHRADRAGLSLDERSEAFDGRGALIGWKLLFHRD